MPYKKYQFQSALLDASHTMLVLAHQLRPAKPVYAQGDLIVARGDLALWFLLQGQPFDIGRVYGRDGETRGYYVDALEPVSWQGSDPSTLTEMVDLFLDIWIWPDLRFCILDESELEEAERSGWISAQSSALARRTIHRLTDEIEAGTFPPPSVLEYEIPASEVAALARP